MRIAVDECRQQITGTLQKNFSETGARRIADYLLWAEMSGIKTQGVIKMTGTEPLQNIKPQHTPFAQKDTTLSRLINAGANPAPLVSQVAVDGVIEKAKAPGIGIVGVRNIFSTNGAQPFYAKHTAK